MATVTITASQSKTEKKIKNKEKDLVTATASENLDTVIHNVKKLDNTCSFTKCKNRIVDFAINCKYCNSRFCTTHGLPEIHGCGEAVRRDEKRKFLHPGGSKLPEEKHTQAANKLTQKLKQMQFERKSKQTKGKKN